MGLKIKLKCPDAKGRPTYWPREVKNDLHLRKKCPTTIAENETRFQKDQEDRVEVIKTGNGNAQQSDNSEDRISTARPVPTSTHHVQAQHSAASSGKRTLAQISSESPPVAKKLRLICKEGQRKSSGMGTADRYNSLKQGTLRDECHARHLPAGGSNQDLRQRLRLDDATRMQKSTTQKSVEENVTSNNSQTSSEKNIIPHSATIQDPTPDDATFDVYPESVPTANYAAMGYMALRNLCSSRSLRHRGINAMRLRQNLMKYDRQLAGPPKKLGVEVDAEREPAGLGFTASASPLLAAFIDLDSSSDDGETLEQRTLTVNARAAILDKEPVSDYVWTVNKAQHPLVPANSQVEARQAEPKDRVSAGVLSDKGTYLPPYSPRLFLESPRRSDKESNIRRTPFTNHPASLQQPLVSLLNLSMKDASTGANEHTHPEAQKKTKPTSEHSTKMTEKEEFNANYVTESPSWICCCITPGYEVRQKKLAEFSADCLYHVSQLAQQETFTMKEYQEYLVIQQTLGRTKSCLCQKPAADHPEHQETMTQGGFILAQIWREQLIRRQSLTTFRPDMAVYRRKGVLDVMQNIQEDFMMELSSHQQKGPLVLWARMEAMA